MFKGTPLLSLCFRSHDRALFVATFVPNSQFLSGHPQLFIGFSLSNLGI